MKINLLDVPLYYINLDKDIAKAQTLEQGLRRVGFQNITRFPGIPDSPKRVGVARSHLELLKTLADIKTPFIVIEDDVKIKLKSSNISIPANTDAFYLGTSCFGLWGAQGERQVAVEKVGEQWRLYNMLSAHAIMYCSQEYVNFLINGISSMLSLGNNQDRVRAETMKYFNIFANDKPSFTQRAPHDEVTKMAISKMVSCPASGLFVGKNFTKWPRQK